MPLIDVQLVLSDQSLGARIRVRLDTDEWDLAVVKIAKKLRNAGTPDAIVAGFMGDDGRPAASLRFMTADGAMVTDAEDVMDNECIYALLGGAELPRDGDSGGSGSSGGKGKGKGKGKDKAKAAAKTVFGPSDVVIWRKGLEGGSKGVLAGVIANDPFPGTRESCAELGHTELGTRRSPQVSMAVRQYGSAVFPHFQLPLPFFRTIFPHPRTPPPNIALRRSHTPTSGRSGSASSTSRRKNSCRA